MKDVAIFIGTRPEAIKLAPIIRMMKLSHTLNPIVISTGQHREMLQQVISLFDLHIDHSLDVMTHSQSLGALSSRLLAETTSIINSIRPAYALVQGDTTSVLMSAISCYYNKVPLGHIEAGLRTGNLQSPFPEEGNRRMVSQIADLHFAPTSSNMDNLLREGIDKSRIFVTGNTGIDALLIEIQQQESPEVQATIHADLTQLIGSDFNIRPFILITGHRRENFGDPFRNICEAIAYLARSFPGHRFVYPVHLNPSVQTPVNKILGGISNVFLLPPLPYRTFVALMKSCNFILSDSGGIQEEAPTIGKPILVMRDTTERPEGLNSKGVHLVGTNKDLIIQIATKLITADSIPTESSRTYGNGHASEMICSILSNRIDAGA